MNYRKFISAAILASFLLTNLVQNGFAVESKTAPNFAANMQGGTANLSNAPLSADADDILGTPNYAESATTSRVPTAWGWYYNLTAPQINSMGKQNNLRPFNLVPNGESETTPRFHVLFVRNAGIYKLNDWNVVANRTLQNAEQLSSPGFRNSGWRVANIAQYNFKNNAANNAVERRVATIMVKDPFYNDYDVRSDLTRSELMALGNQRLRVVDLDQFDTAQGSRYAAVIVPNSGEHYKNWGWLFNTTKSFILDKIKDVDGKQFRVVDIERRDNGNYDAIIVQTNWQLVKWYSNQTNTTIYNDVLRRHGSYYNNQIHDGIRFTDLVVYKDANNETKFELLTMENGVGKYPVSRDNVPEMKEIDEAFLKTMSRHGVPAASFALSKNGKVIYRAAFGYADLAQATPATRNTKGRIASISKVFTAAAIMKLIEQKKISIDSKVFGPNGILNSLKPFDYEGYNGTDAPNLNQITVRHLLTHTAGWDRGRSGDPLIPDDENDNTCDNTAGQCEPTIAKTQYVAARAKQQGILDESETRGANAVETIRWMMKPDDKDFLPVWTPGTRQVYSNFGFTVLQQIVEEVSGVSYTNYIANMTAQMGFTGTVGKSNPNEIASNEWKHYDEPGASLMTNPYWTSVAPDDPVPFSYKYDMNSMLGHGGLTATPTELVKFASKMDSTAENPWIPIGLFKAMMLRPAAIAPDDYNYYGLGWSVDQMNNDNDDNFRFSHGGRLTGSSGLTLKGWYHRKVSMAFLFNSTADSSDDEVKNEIEPFIGAKDDDGTLEFLANNK